jgi:FkbM family methyltransferase
MSEIRRHDPRDKPMPFEPRGLVHRALTATARAMHRRGILWRANFTVAGQIAGRPVRVPLEYGAGWEHLAMREAWLFRGIERLLPGRPGAFIDVGVNVGHTLLKVKVADPDRPYVGFEPNPQCLTYVQHLINANQFTQCTVVPVGVSNRTGVLKLYLNPDVDPSATLVEGFREPDRYRRSVLVPVFVGDDMLDRLDVEDVAVMKIDVEGGELDVMRGFERTLQRTKPYVFCEVLPVFDPQSEVGQFRIHRQRELIELLSDLGYNIFRVYVDDRVEELAEFGIHSDMTLANYLFVPNAELSDFRRRFAVTGQVRPTELASRPVHERVEQLANR